MPIYEIGEHEGHHYFAMKLVEGGSLEERIARGAPFPTFSPADRSQPLHAGCCEMKEAVRLVATVSRAVHYAHQRGILHRDLKPGNILLDERGEPHVTDFGLAKLIEDDSSLTHTGMLMGTPSYMSPEQAEGKNAQLTTASDVWSLGSILYELLTGQRAFRGATPMETLRQVMEQEPKKPSALNPDVDRDLETICLKCLEKNPAGRYASAAALADDLEHWQGHEPILARRASTFERVVKWAYRQPVLAAAVVLLNLILVVGAAGVLWQWRRADHAQRATTVSNEQLRRALGQMDSIQLQRAEEYMAEERRLDALPRWALVLRNDPSNRIAAERLMSTLSHRTWARLACPPMEHSNRVTHAEFSRDGTRVVTSSADNTAWVWDAATGQRLAGPFAHSAEINTAAFSPDGRFVVTASQDKTARIWNAETGVPVTEPLPCGDDVHTAQFSPDGKLVFVSGGRVGQLWDVRTGQRVGAALKAAGLIADARFSSDGSRLAMACDGGEAHVWELSSGVCQFRFAHADKVQSAAFSPDGRWLLTASNDKTARVWDVENGQPLGEPLQHQESVWGAEFSPDGQRIVTVSHDRTAQIWDAHTGQKISAPLKHDAAVRSALFSPEGLRIATAAWDKTVRVWDALTGEPLTEALVQEASAFSAKFDPSGERLLTASNGKTVMIWQINSAAVLKLHPDTRHTWAAAFSPDARRVAVGTRYGKSRVCDTATGDGLTVLQQGALTNPSIRCVEFSPDGLLVVAGAETGFAGVWDSASGQLLTRPRPLHNAPVVSTRFSHDGRRFVTASWDNGVRICDTLTGESVALLIHGATPFGAEFSPDSKWVLTEASNSVVRLWDAGNGHVVREFQHAAIVNSAHFSPDGRRVLTASIDFAARVWDAQSGVLLGVLPHSHEVFSARFSPDGRMIVTAHRSDDSLRVWDAHTLKPLTPLFGEGRSPEFDRTSQRLTDGSAHRGKNVRIWDAKTGLRLSEGLLQGEWCRFSHFSPDGRLILIAGDRGVQIRETPPAPLPVPEWLPELAEALAGQRFNQQGMLEPVRSAELWTVQQKMAAWLKVAGHGSTRSEFYGRWARWFLADASTRTVLPSSPLTLPEYAAQLTEQDTFESSCEALRLQPANGLIMAGLVRQLMPGKERTASYGEWMAARATELAPGHAVTWWTYANWLLATNRCVEALKAMARAQPLVPNSPKFYNDQGAMMARCGEWENALVAFTKSVELTGSSTNSESHLRIDALHARATVLRQLGRHAEAEAADLLKAEAFRSER